MKALTVGFASGLALGMGCSVKLNCCNCRSVAVSLAFRYFLSYWHSHSLPHTELIQPIAYDWILCAF